MLIEQVCETFANSDGLPFSDVLSEAKIREALDECGVEFRDRIFNPITTTWAFLSQVLSDDHSCRDTVSRVVAHRSASGLETCSPSTAAYCKARIRLPESVTAMLCRNAASDLQSSIGDDWKWNGRNVYVVDGSTISMPDTPANQAVYPQHGNQADGLGFPIGRTCILLSLATGACHDMAIASYTGKGTGERNLFRQMFDRLSAGDIVLADALYDDYFLVCELLERGVDVVFRAGSNRKSGWIYRYDKGDTVLIWKRPQRPEWMTKEQYAAIPERIQMRQVSVDVKDKNSRVKKLKVVTSILDVEIDGSEFGDLYHQRWHGEVDIRSIKCTMQMDILRCKTPGMVRKEIWIHLLAYNLMRSIVATAAAEHDATPREISFKGAKQTIAAFAPKIENARPCDRKRLISDMLKTIAYHRVGNRPGRWEPRANKRRPKPQRYLTVPRDKAKKRKRDWS